MRNRPLRRSGALVLGLFLFASGAGAQFGKNKVQYRAFDWQIYHSPHFDVYYYTDEEAQLEKIVSFAESAYDELSQVFDFQIKEPTTLIFYATHSAFEQNNVILNFIPEGVGAFATDVRNRMVLPVDLPDQELLNLIAHELTHIFEYHILFQGKRSRALASRPPTWLMEGLASFMARDEGTTDRMILRDAVVNDQIPSIAQRGVEGFLAYRFGAAAFRFMADRWGEDAVRDFLYEFRNTFGAKVDRALERSFRIKAEEFDADFRRWLRKKYLPSLVETGEPSDFGRPFRIERSPQSQAISPSASPSGELLVAYTTERQDVDIALWDVPNRRFLRNLTKGDTAAYQYLIGQFLTVGPRMGRDLAFAPDGNRVAVFGKRERDRSLIVIDVLDGDIEAIYELGGAEQPFAPAWRPDGKRIAFSAIKDGRFDIFEIDLATRGTRRITDDPAYDGSPVYTPDGQSLFFSSQVGTYDKLFRVELGEGGQRFQITHGEWNDKEPVFTADGERAYFTSDRDGIDNIWRYDFAKEELTQITNVVTGCFQPTVVQLEHGEEGVVYTGLWKGRYDLYLADLAVDVAESETVPLRQEPVQPEEFVPFEPDILVAIDDENKERYHGFRKLFLEDADAFFGVADDQTLVGAGVIRMSDYLGDRRLILTFSGQTGYRDFDVLFINLSRRLQWSLHLFDDRSYFLAQDSRTGRIVSGQSAFEQTGLIGGISYPFSYYYRAELGVGYILRKIGFQSFAQDPNTGEIVPVVLPREDDFPQIQGSLVGDTTLYTNYGPHSGNRWRLFGSYAPDLDDSGSLTSTAYLDARQYFPVTRRSEFAIRGFFGISEGNFPNPFYFGGLDDFRGVEYRRFAGDRAFYTNFEYRFPLIDFVATPVFAFGGIRGRLFVDIGGAYFSNGGYDWKFWDSENNRLQDAIASYGWGFSVWLFGLNLHWDFAKLWDFDQTLSDWRTSFWIGYRF